MLLYLTRHADAEQKKPGMSDFERELTDIGRKNTEKMAIILKRMNLKFDLIVSSPLVRAVQTAKIFHDVMGVQSEIITTNELIPGSDFKSLLNILFSFGVGNLLAVGHEPHLGEFLSWLVGLPKPVEFKKNSIACIEILMPVEAGGNLKWLIHPDMFSWFETI
ncbi:phosphohistidine phosphatase, SixA [Candidatus Kryptobacter tengchongensis]|uniref:Phosphohistidine phosphatase, SixA n=1 Tax=Kryptobacter tengchongensis TaxID=1643429 RepID=A0A656DEA0_KRYT1|nr:phosphohistidine phosphatase SixA [Candidatus Kryptobacter tengchongensis]CUS99658.1 phosphohistidine phosphatase, SixA [Candidatus Kryptobacter tengchongensis]CUT05683.1 phosphohistidine phosphatase, SixA [Candidatus Kryptobacter tengchongensis]CUU02639.1 phosphohistidine phosphatase, SixA [Candidatus Kryptobacter tengchongensis]CUU07410.1 phosphohistidine phosphatase, SixA [Candidatus Kryptobacter tengchongensis]